jgi:hypothetical protein
VLLKGRGDNAHIRASTSTSRHHSHAPPWPPQSTPAAPASEAAAAAAAAAAASSPSLEHRLRDGRSRLLSATSPPPPSSLLEPAATSGRLSAVDWVGDPVPPPAAPRGVAAADDGGGDAELERLRLAADAVPRRLSAALRYAERAAVAAGQRRGGSGGPAAAATARAAFERAMALTAAPGRRGEGRAHVRCAYGNFLFAVMVRCPAQPDPVRLGPVDPGRAI